MEKSDSQRNDESGTAVYATRRDEMVSAAETITRRGTAWAGGSDKACTVQGEGICGRVAHLFLKRGKVLSKVGTLCIHLICDHSRGKEMGEAEDRVRRER